MKSDKKKAALYIRVSTQYQIDGDSLDTQKSGLISYAKVAFGINAYTVFEDAGFSGKNTVRPAYQKMMTELRKRDYTHLIVWKIDRISRNLLDFADLYEELKALKVSFISRTEQFDTSTAIGEAMLKIILIFAELERKMTSERVSATMLSRAKKGIWNGGRVPLGYDYDKATHTFSINSKETRAIQLIYNQYEWLKSSTAVAELLNKKEIRTKAGNPWGAVGVCKILNNQFYCGHFVYNKRKCSDSGKLKDKSEWVVAEDCHERIIGDDQFFRCQQLLKKNMIGSDRRTYNRKNCHIFAGLLFCDYCGRIMAAQVGRKLKKHGNISCSRYSCYNRRQSTCQNRFTSDTAIGPFILNFLVNLAHTSVVFGKSTTMDTFEKKLLRGPSFSKIASIEKNSLERLYEIYKERISALNALDSIKDNDPSCSPNDILEHLLDFFTTHKISINRSVDYTFFIRRADPWKSKRFMEGVFSDIYIRDGLITGMRLQNGMEFRFIYRES